VQGRGTFVHINVKSCVRIKVGRTRSLYSRPTCTDPAIPVRTHRRGANLFPRHAGRSKMANMCVPSMDSRGGSGEAARGAQGWPGPQSESAELSPQGETPAVPRHFELCSETPVPYKSFSPESSLIRSLYSWQSTRSPCTRKRAAMLACPRQNENTPQPRARVELSGVLLDDASGCDVLSAGNNLGPRFSQRVLGYACGTCRPVENWHERWRVRPGYGPRAGAVGPGAGEGASGFFWFLN